MALEIKLSPPVISSKLPAFAGTTLKIPFTISKAVSGADFNKIAIKIKSVQTNVEKMAFITPNYYYDSASRIYMLSCDINDYNKTVEEKNQFKPQVGQYYKVQIALVSKVGEVGYYSTVGAIKYTTEPKVIIKDREKDGQELKFHTYEYTGLYSQVDGDYSEKVYSYCFNLYNERNELVSTSGELIHDSSNDTEYNQSSDTWTVRKNLDANVNYEIEYVITTMNGFTRNSGRYPIIEAETKMPNVHAQLSAVNHYDDGYIYLQLIGDRSGSAVNGRFILMRSSSEDNYDSWYELTRFDLSQYDSNTNQLICKDYTVQQGIYYRYAIRAYTPQGLFSDRMMNKEGPVQCDFEDAFLFDGERQLKIRFNPKVNTFKSTVLESKTDTIGGKYPFIFRNGNVEYKEFQISGLISLLGDENNEFLSNLPAATSDVQQDFGHWLTTDNIRKEREFKMLVLSWLTNGKPKIFRSPSEGNYIIRLMNTSLSPNDTLGRMLHTFTSTAYEIAAYNFDNLKEYSFAVEDYTETRTLKLNQVTITKNQGSYPFPQPAVYASVSAEPGAEFTYLLDGITDRQTAYVGLTGTYNFPEGVLASTPLVDIRLVDTSVNEDIEEMVVTYGYYDNTAYNFSIIDSISLSDKIVQVVGQGMSNNLISTFEDIRRSPGAFHYIRIQPRDVVKILQVGNSYYYNNSGDLVGDLKPNLIYYIYKDSITESNRTEYYLDGQDGTANQATRRLISDINYNFRITGMSEGQVVDFNGQGQTSGRYDALTNFSSISEMFAGNGLILDMIYQQKEYTYVVEVDGEHYDIRVVNSKVNWQTELSKYQSLLDSNAPTTEINAQKEKVDQAYSTYLYWLELSLDSIKEEYGVEYAI